MDKENMIHTNTAEYFSDMKNSEILSFTAGLIDLEVIMLNKISQMQKNKYHRFSPHMGKLKTIDLNLSTDYYRIRRVRIEES